MPFFHDIIIPEESMKDYSDSHVSRALSERKQKSKGSKFYKLEYLYRWKSLLEAPVDTNDEDVFRDVEKQLYRSGLHSKLVRKDDRYILYVREGEFDYAKDLTDGKVSDIYNKTSPEYILFKEDYEYKNEKFYQDDSNGRRMRINTRMSMFIIAIIIIITMMILYYVKK